MFRVLVCALCGPAVSNAYSFVENGAHSVSVEFVIEVRSSSNRLKKNLFCLEFVMNLALDELKYTISRNRYPEPDVLSIHFDLFREIVSIFGPEPNGLISKSTIMVTP